MMQTLGDAPWTPELLAQLARIFGQPGGQPIPGAPAALTPQQLLLQQATQAQGQYDQANPQTLPLNALLANRGMAGGFLGNNPQALMYLLGGGGQVPGMSMADRLRMMMPAAGGY